MELSGPDNTTFLLEIDGYQYPHIADQSYDSDWLFITIRVRDRRGPWAATDPCVLTWEVGWLADWFDVLAAGRPDRVGFAFLEPNLSFDRIDHHGSHTHLRVYFEQNFRPPWDPSRFGFTNSEVAAIDLQLSTDQLRQAAADLRRQLQRFPVRVGRKIRT